MSEVREFTTEPFLDGLRFAETPRWHDGRLWYSDFFDHAVFSVGDDGRPRREADVEAQPSGLGWLPDGRLLVVSMIDRKLMRREPDGTLVRHGDLEPWATGHANDMVVDSQGRAYVGNFGFDLDGYYEGRVQPTTTSMVRIDPDGTTREVATDLNFPNGCVLFPDERTMVVAETFASQLTAFDVAPDGSLSNRRVWAPLGECAPDGICLDAEGCVWVANAYKPECLRVAEGGEVVGRAVTSQPTFACMLGGPERRVLHCCTAGRNDSPERREVRLGRIERVEVEVPGAGRP